LLIVGQEQRGPANEFVMGFLGPVTRLGDRLVRPHDIEVFAAPVEAGVRAEIIRLQRIGYEVRADVRSGGDEVRVQLTRGQSESLELAVGSTVWVRPVPLAATLSVPA